MGPAFDRGRQLLEDGELADAIRAFLDALDEDPEHLDSYFALMETYELAFEVYPDPELLHQVQNVLRGLRDRDLTEEQEGRARIVEDRVGQRLAAAGHPPPAPGRTPPED